MDAQRLRSNPQVQVFDNADGTVSLRIVLDQPKTTGDDVIASGYGRYVVDNYEINNGATLEIQDGADLEIG